MAVFREKNKRKALILDSYTVRMKQVTSTALLIECFTHASSLTSGPKDESNVFLQNFSRLPQNYMTNL
jgi:hypothetical protein